MTPPPTLHHPQDASSYERTKALIEKYDPDARLKAKQQQLIGTGMAAGGIRSPQSSVRSQNSEWWSLSRGGSDHRRR